MTNFKPGDRVKETFSGTKGTVQESYWSTPMYRTRVLWDATTNIDSYITTCKTSVLKLVPPEPQPTMASIPPAAPPMIGVSAAAIDMVNQPPHYTSHPSGIECIQITEHMSFTLGNAFKYLWRADLKNGLEDLKKARYYVDREIAKREKQAAKSAQKAK